MRYGLASRSRYNHVSEIVKQQKRGIIASADYKASYKPLFLKLGI